MANEKVTDEEVVDVAEIAEEETAEPVLTEEEERTLQLLLDKVSHRSKSFIPATSKADKKVIKGSNVITDDGEKMTTTDNLKQDMLDLNASAHAGRVLEGRIIGCRKAGDSGISTNLAVVEYGNGTCTVLIPDYLLFNYDVKVVRDDNQQARLESRVVRMIGTDIKFVVKQFDQATHTAYADRLKALEQEAYNNYIRHLKATDKPRVKVGDIIKAQVTAVYKNRLTVCALGSETTIYQNNKDGISEVSWYHISDLSLQFKKNMIVPCKVMSVERVTVDKYGEKYDMVVTELSIKRCEENPQVKYFDDYKIGQFCEVIITNVSESATGIYGIINGVGKVDCMIAYPSYGDIPKIGDRRVVKITQKETKTDKGLNVEADGTPVRRIYALLADM